MIKRKKIPFVERRRFIRHPVSFPLSYNILSKNGVKTEDVVKLHKLASKDDFPYAINISQGGLLFASRKAVKSGTLLLLRMPFQGKVFNVKARVAHCERNHDTRMYNIGVLFYGLKAAYKVKLIEQLYLISEFRDLRSIELGREMSFEEASSEWISRYAARFKKLYW